jgi:hypothetical protein
MTASLVESLMTDYLERVGKTRWCDKSPSNLSHLDTLSALFPSARFVCLYRACLDTVQSCIEANRYGAMREHRPYVAKHPGNLPLAMTENWLDKTGALLAFEASHQAQCVRIRYEDLVECPPRELARVLKFLELPVVADLHLTALRHRHFEGGGDPKARFECDVHTRSVGKGLVIPLTFLPIQAIRQINLLSHQL